MQSVATKAGNRAFVARKPLHMPAIIPAVNPINAATRGGAPIIFIRKAVVAAAKASTDPTERSTSPPRIT
jgi:hypothetical protein